LKDENKAWPITTVNISTPAFENRERTSTEKLSVIFEMLVQSTEPCWTMPEAGTSDPDIVTKTVGYALKYAKDVSSAESNNSSN
jgi:hypothetical protein